METRQWYYVVQGNQAGPVSESVLSQMLKSGELVPETLVWTDTLKDWVAASSVEELINPVVAVVQESFPPAPLDALRASDKEKNVVAVGYAGFWKRVAACLIDSVIMTVAALFAGLVLGVLYGVLFRSSGGAGIFGNLVGMAMQWLYFALMESSSSQATVGKLVVGIKVVDLDGGRLSFSRATGRHFSKMISAFTFGIGYIMAGFTARKQALHDMIASCLVVNRD